MVDNASIWVWEASYTKHKLWAEIFPGLNPKNLFFVLMEGRSPGNFLLHLSGYEWLFLHISLKFIQVHIYYYFLCFTVGQEALYRNLGENFSWTNNINNVHDIVYESLPLP